MNHMMNHMQACLAQSKSSLKKDKEKQIKIMAETASTFYSNNRS